VAIAALLIGVFVSQQASAQESGTASLALMDAGGGGEEFHATVHLAGGTEAIAEVAFTDQALGAVDLEAGTYIVMPVASAEFGYMGWAVATDGVCPDVPTAGGAEIEVDLASGDSTIVCIYHEGGALDVSNLEGADDGIADTEGDGVSDDDQVADGPTPQAPSTGTGTVAMDGNSSPISSLMLIGGGIALAGALAMVGLRRRDGR
jgi:hypothetical protein